jgi:phosphoribosyl 1,2-cyclic phosphodiesterase
MLEICAIASGSNGNCYYIGNEKDAILIDAGISCKQIISRMIGRNLNPEKLRAVIISHEHSDHIKGVRVLAKKLNIQVWLTAKTYYNTYRNLLPDNPRFFTPGSIITVEEFKIHSFLKNHDAAEPCSFRIEQGGTNIGVFTDIGEPCSNVLSHINQCDALFLESNYDEKMLMEGRYPYYLKQRIASSKGHLSNIQAVKLLEHYAGKNLGCVFLSHLSAENNRPAVAIAAMQPLSSKFELRMTSRYGASEVFKL